MSSSTTTTTHQLEARLKSRIESSMSVMERIEYVDVSQTRRHGGHSFYVVKVYLHRSEGQLRTSESVYACGVVTPASSVALFKLMLTEREPDYQLNYRFADFVELRKALRFCCETPTIDRKCHNCSHCQELASILKRSNRQMWSLKRCVAAAATDLADFVNDVVDLTIKANENAPCATMNQARRSVARFMRKQYETSLGLI